MRELRARQREREREGERGHPLSPESEKEEESSSARTIFLRILFSKFHLRDCPVLRRRQAVLASRSAAGLSHTLCACKIGECGF